MSSFADHIYARQKLTDAVEALAVGEEEVRSRLLTALKCLVTLREEQIPEKLRGEYASILRVCSKSGPIKDKNGVDIVGSFQHTLGCCRKRTAAKLAQRVFDLHWEICRTLREEGINSKGSASPQQDAKVKADMRHASV